ncbi:NfeD family protein [Leptolyngbya cf. ectocarpi LEGE 11479]|uniref:NfeD family protein n=1 Tax=Leptolyngbya cf. ectocarpi LEGE 11479 TaxID=1828722 RepID=A0A928ZRJ0_LEPEC|nr:NfeD family protein [Leptolyngbya ectocarpi]MBE9066628.1 NfeD family protein [Leptolyngbya cf. ectocarpi LEGE 11479]
MLRYRSNYAPWLWNFFSAGSYDEASADRGILNAQGFVEDVILANGQGRVRLHGVYWLARVEKSCQQSLDEGTVVTILRREGLTLVVQPARKC